MTINRPNQVRIIGGKWRGRKLHFPALTELRPTPDRVRETLFNWLTPYIVGAECLDLFAGSGALGFEALSRGAKSVLMVDQSSKVIHSLQENASRFGAASEVDYYCGIVPSDAVPVHHRQFNIVFLDPPFHQEYLVMCCRWLENLQCLAEHALVYMEAESDLELLLPAHWSIIRQQKAGQVKYYLVKVVSSA